MTDQLSSWTPYNFAFNDPSNLNDPMGDLPYTRDKVSGRRIYENDGGGGRGVSYGGGDEGRGASYGGGGFGGGGAGGTYVVDPKDYRAVLVAMSTGNFEIDGPQGTGYWFMPYGVSSNSLPDPETFGYSDEHAVENQKTWHEISLGANSGESINTYPAFDEPYQNISDGLFMGGAFLGIAADGLEYATRQISYRTVVNLGVQSAFRNVKTVTKSLKTLGYVGMAASTGIDLYNVVHNGGTPESWIRLGFGVVNTGIGLIPYVGLPAAIMIGAWETEGGMDGVYDAAGKGGYQGAWDYVTK